jgi:hypothetical protein
MRNKIQIRNFEISAGKGREVWKWDAYRYAFKVKVKNLETGAIAYFNFYGSIMDYEKGKDELSGDDLKVAFWAFLGDAYGGGLDFADFCEEFGYSLEDKEARQIWNKCTEQKERAERLGINEDLRIDLLNNELAEV